MNPSEVQQVQQPLAPLTAVNRKSDFNYSNVLDISTERVRIRSTLEKCQAILSKHCGPNSNYAMILNAVDAGTFRPNVFTRDGIGILGAIEFMSPQETFIKNLITYIGGRVDNAAKDGTTTSMLFSTVFLNEMITDENVETLQRLNLSLQELDTITRRIMDNIVTRMKDHAKFVPEGEDDQTCEEAGLIAFAQALSSSGGNLELAQILKSIFEKVPRVAWQYVAHFCTRRENNTPFSVEVPKYDYRIKCGAALEGMFNHALGTEYYGTDVDLLIYPNSMADNGDWFSDLLMKYLKNRDYKQAAPLHIVSSRASSTLIMFAHQTNMRHPGKIVIWDHAPERSVGGQLWQYELKKFAAVCGVNAFRPQTVNDLVKDYIVHADSVHWQDTSLEVYGVIPYLEDTCLHPFLAKPELATPYYTQTVNEIKTQLKLYSEGHFPDSKSRSYFVDILNQLTTVHRPTLRIGGSTHEQIANMDVVQDAQGAIMSSLNHGYLVNGVFSMSAAIREVSTDTANLPDTDEHQAAVKAFSMIVLNACNKAIDTVKNAIYSVDGSVPADVSDDTQYVNVLDYDNQVRTLADYCATVKEAYKDTDSIDPVSELGVKLATTYPVLQPLNISTELFKRVRELLFKFVFTNQIVVNGGVADNRNKTKKDKE